MTINETEFTSLQKELTGIGKPVLDYLAPYMGKVYVLAITREDCSACEEQRPKLNKLAKTMIQKYGDKLVFTRIHIKRPQGSDEESLRSKGLFHHYFYPTNLILLRTHDKGAIEYYKNAAPEMDELEKNIEIALKIAEMLEK